ncbi:unnamed protein product [Colias eurytheme]|nr:unnamed protein product [Colias eurytheme]
MTQPKVIEPLSPRSYYIFIRMKLRASPLRSKTQHNENDSEQRTPAALPKHFRLRSAPVGGPRSPQLTGPMTERDGQQRRTHEQQRRRTAQLAAAAIYSFPVYHHGRSDSVL